MTCRFILAELFTPLRGRVRPHQGYKVSYVLVAVVVVVVVVVAAAAAAAVVVVVVVVVVVPGQIF